MHALLRHRLVGGLSAGAWQRRHAAMMAALLGVLIADLAVALYRHLPVEQVSTAIPVVSLFVLLAAAERVPRPLRALLASMGLLTACVALVAFSGGALHVHLVFPLAMVAICLYHDRIAFGSALVFVTVLYLVVCWSFPELAYPAGLPYIEVVRWSLSLWLACLLAAVLAVVDWRLTSHAQAESEVLTRALSAASARQRHASELHDTVAQDLATAQYALQAHDLAALARALDRATLQVRGMVASLLPMEGARAGQTMVRAYAAQGDAGTPPGGQGA